jgi:hypothetical protein
MIFSFGLPQFGHDSVLMHPLIYFHSWVVFPSVIAFDMDDPLILTLHPSAHAPVFAVVQMGMARAAFEKVRIMQIVTKDLNLPTAH